MSDPESFRRGVALTISRGFSLFVGLALKASHKEWRQQQPFFGLSPCTRIRSMSLRSKPPEDRVAKSAILLRRRLHLGTKYAMQTKVKETQCSPLCLPLSQRHNSCFDSKVKKRSNSYVLTQRTKPIEGHRLCLPALALILFLCVQRRVSLLWLLFRQTFDYLSVRDFKALWLGLHNRTP